MMMKMYLAAVVVLISFGAAQAQSVDAGPMSSTVDGTNAYYTGGSPGTVGAMNAVAQGLATSADDVVLQQQGRSTLSDGARPSHDGTRVETSGYAPGTVGATPGATPVR